MIVLKQQRLSLPKNPTQGASQELGEHGFGKCSLSLLEKAELALPPISLPEIMERAELQTRIDRKYMLPVTEVATLLNEMQTDDARILEIDERRSFAYESVYFDTPELRSYLAAAHKRRRRFKIRTRSYLDSDQCWLEVKTTGARESTIKERLAYHPMYRSDLTPGRSFVEETLIRAAVADAEYLAFIPTLLTRYHRVTLFIPQSRSRTTIDTDLVWQDPDRRQLHLTGQAIVETKTGCAPSVIDRKLWARGYRPVRISKYATGLAALYPELPSCRWSRTLRRYFSEGTDRC
jgi:hypothetical protein